MIPAIISNSKTSGPIENKRNLNKNSKPFTPLSIMRLKAPVFREIWYRKESL